MWASERSRRGGFTLIELMVSLIILTIILGMIYAAYSSVVRTIEEARAASERLLARQFIQRSLGQNLAQATEGWSPGAAYRTSVAASEGQGVGRGIMRYPFMGAQSTSDNGRADQLSFVSSAPMIGAMALPGTMKLCTYEIVERESEDGGSDAEPETALRITESPWVDPALGVEQRFAGPRQAADLVGREIERMGVEPATVSMPVYAWELAYYDGKAWVDTWDSQQAGRLPWSVRVRVKVRSAEDDAFAESIELDPESDPEVIELVLPLPSGAGVYDAPPDYVRPNSRETT
jgi:prepilin-type N-terminal cleavage/methylation domain-containing protein